MGDEEYYNANENEKYERGVFGSVTEIVKFDMNDMKIVVYDKNANVTLHTDFHLRFGEEAVVVNEQMTLLFLETENGWRIVHEHHSPPKQYRRIKTSYSNSHKKFLFLVLDKGSCSFAGF